MFNSNIDNINNISINNNNVINDNNNDIHSKYVFENMNSSEYKETEDLCHENKLQKSNIKYYY